MYEYKMRGAFDDMEIVAYCDNDRSKWGKEIEGVKIISPDEIGQYNFDEIYIASDLYFSDIKDQLIKECNIREEIIKNVIVQENKYDGELSYWKASYAMGKFCNSCYRSLMLNILGEDNDDCFRDKVVADFGCGPQGSLYWTDKPKVKIGIDVLAVDYFENFPEELQNHDMIYLKSSENVIPLPNNYVDCLITINSLDHVYYLEKIAKELNRITKKGGILLGQFNMNEPKTECEPQKLTVAKLKNELLTGYEVERMILGIKNGEKVVSMDYDVIEQKLGEQEAILWVKAIKK